MFRRSHLDIYVWPLALVCSVIIAFPIWLHHSVLESKAGFPTRALAEAWARHEAATHHCLPEHVQTNVIDESGGGPDLSNGHPFVITLKCHQSSIWWKMTAVFIGPWLLISILVRAVGPAREPRH